MAKRPLINPHTPPHRPKAGISLPWMRSLLQEQPVLWLRTHHLLMGDCNNGPSPQRVSFSSASSPPQSTVHTTENSLWNAKLITLLFYLKLSIISLQNTIGQYRTRPSYICFSLCLECLSLICLDNFYLFFKTQSVSHSLWCSFWFP